MTYGQPPSDQGGNNQGGYGQQGGFQPTGGGSFGQQPTPGGGYTPPAGGGYQPPPGGGYQPPPAGGGYQPPGGGGYSPPPSPVYGGPAPTSGSPNIMAIISLVCGILSIPAFCTVYGAIILGIAAIALGFVGMNQIKTTGQGGRGLAIAGIICGVIGLLIGIGCVALGTFGGGLASGLLTSVPLTLTATAP